MDQDFENHNMETLESAVTATNSQSKDTTILNANETEYLSKLYCQQLNMKTISGEDDEDDDDETLVWSKAVKTEAILREELALHRRLSKDVWKTRSLRNLIKLLLRLKKLFGARSSAIKILRSIMRLKAATRCKNDCPQNLFKLAISIRASLLEFQQDYKIFGSEFLFEDVNLYAAFDAI